MTSRRRFVAVVLLVGAYFLSGYVRRASPALRPWSRHGVEGFLRYSFGDYGGAARAYQTHLRDLFALDGLRAEDEEIALLHGDTGRARSLATRALDRDPRASRSLLTVAEIALDQNSIDEARRSIEQALAVVPDDFDALILAAVARARSGEYREAVAAMAHALRDWQPEARLMTFIRALGEIGRLYHLPTEQRPACLLAHFHRYLRTYDESQGRLAIARAQDAIENGDGVDDAYVTIGVVHQKRAEDEQALSAFLSAIATNARNAEAHRWAATVYADRGDLANEYRMTRAAHDLAPDEAAYALPFARVLADKLGDYRTALEVEARVLASGRETAGLDNDLGSLHARLGHVDDSLGFYSRAVELEPNAAWHLRGLGWALTLQDRYDDAIEVLRRALRLRPGFIDARSALALAYRETGRYDDAVPEFERVYEEEPSRRAYLPDLCITYQLAARFADARACAADILRQVPGNPDMAFLRSFTLAGALDSGAAR